MNKHRNPHLAHFNALVSFILIFYCDDHISLFVPFIDIPMSVNNLFKRIGSIYGWF